MAVFPSDWDALSLRQALRVGTIYLVVSATWIYFSDLAVERMVSDPDAVRQVQTWKGWGFVLVSALLISFLVYREVRRVKGASRTLEALVHQSLAGIYLIQSGRFLFVNPTLADIFGYEPEEMLGSLRVLDLVAEEDRRLVTGDPGTRGRDDELHYLFTGIRKDGQKIQVEVHGTRVDWEGEPAILGVLLDVSERERLERQIREAQKLEAMGKLTGQIAHDFNNFLTGIIGPLDMCLPDLQEGSRERFEVEEARESAIRAAQLSRKLLAFSRNRPRVRRVLDLNRTLEELGPLLDRFLGASVDLRLELHPEPCPVRMDPSDLEQIVMNLVINGGEAVEDQGTVTVRTGREAGPGHGPAGTPDSGLVRLEVEDDGVGMDAPTRNRIFEPLFTTKSDGTGLGLSTVFGIVDEAHGELAVRSEAGAGTTFSILLPAAAGETEVVVAEPGEGVEGGTGQRVLVVEDEEVILRTVVRALSRFGYEVLAAGSGKEAVALASRKDTRVDLLLTDVLLPDLVGPEVAARVTELQPAARVLYMSGFSDQEMSSRLSRDRDVRLIEKPFGIDELLHAVQDALKPGGRDGSRTG